MCSGAFCVGSSAVGIVAGLLGVVPLAGGPAVAGDQLRGVGPGVGACLRRGRSAAVAAYLGTGRGGPVAGAAGGGRGACVTVGGMKNPALRRGWGLCALPCPVVNDPVALGVGNAGELVQVQLRAAEVISIRFAGVGRVWELFATGPGDNVSTVLGGCRH